MIYFGIFMGFVLSYSTFGITIFGVDEGGGEEEEGEEGERRQRTNNCRISEHLFTFNIYKNYLEHTSSSQP